MPPSRRVLLIGFIVAVVFLNIYQSGPVHAAITLDAHGVTDTGETEGTHTSVTIPGVTAGDAIVCGTSISNSASSVTGVTDNVDGAYSIAVPEVNNTAISQMLGIYYFLNSVGGTVTINASTSVLSNFYVLMCAAYKGVATLSALDATSSVIQTGSVANASSALKTTMANGELIFGSSIWLNTQLPTHGTNFTFLDNASSSFADDEYEVQTSSGSIATTWVNPADTWTAQMATFKAIPPDTTPPSVTWVAPANNSIVSSVTTLTASSTDNVSVASVAFYVGNFGSSLASSTLIGSTSTASGTQYSIPWNTSSAANGSTTLWALSTDTSNNTSTASTTVNVGNNLPAYVYPIKLSTDGIHLVDQNNKPFYMVGEDAFDLTTQVSDADVNTYFADRASRGFNAVWLAAADDADQSNAPLDFYGNTPFDGADFTNEDATYWSHIDYVVQQAASSGITLLLSPAFVGLNSSSGYLNSYLNSSNSVITGYGTFLGNRYKNDPNIIWVLGGDADPASTGLYAKLNVLATAIQAADPNHLITIEASRYTGGDPVPSGGYSSMDATALEYSSTPSWLNINWVYNGYSTTQSGCATNYARSGALPSLMGEDWYEGEHSMTPLELREESYWEAMSGCVIGRVFGNNAIWTMGGPSDTMDATWQSQLGSPGSVAEENLGKLLNSRENWLLVPDASNTVLTAGEQSGTTIAVAARTTDGQTVIAYIPTQRAVTIDMTKVAGTSANAWWFNPQTGTSSFLGAFSTTGSHSFTPPDTNDWTLVLDNAAANLAAPGTTFAASSSSDTTPPSITWISPANDATVSSTITLTASSTDNVSVASVAFYVGSFGSSLASSTLISSTSTISGAQYSFSWNTLGVANGSTTLWALSTDTSNNTSTASTTVNVGNPAILQVTTSTSLSFTASQGATATSSQNIIIKNTGPASTTLNWSASSTQTWLTFTPTSSAIASNATTSVLFVVNPMGLSTGVHNATATISAASASNSPQVLSVTLTINTTGISVSITSPTNGANVTSTITVAANPTSTVGIASLQFLLDGAPLGSLIISPPYTTSWNTVSSSDGSHILTASTTDSNNNIATSTSVTVTVANTTSSPPQSLTATAGNTQVGLSWNAPASNGGSAVNQYLIYNRFTGSSTFVLYATTTVSQTNATATSLTNGQSYDFEILANNSIGTSTASNIVSSTPYTIPNAPTGVSASGGNAQATVSFTPGSSGGSTILYYIATSNSGGHTASSTGSPIVVNGLTNGVAYTFTVVAVNAAGSSTTSSASNSVTPNGSSPAISSFIASPTIVASGTSSTLSWATTLANTVVINQGVGNQSATSSGSVAVNPSSTTIYTLTATNGIGSSTAQTTITVDNTLPSIPQNLATTPVSATEIDLSWTASTDNINVANYQVFRNGVQIATPVASSYQDTDLSASTAYSYTVQAVDEVGNLSGQSSSSSATTQASSGGGGGGGGGGGTMVGVASQYGISNYIGSPAPTSSNITVSTSSLLAEINALQAELASLLARTAQAQSTTPVSTFYFPRNLSVGVKGSDVTNLQRFLIAQASGPAAIKLKNHGLTKNFAILTYSALVEFQKKVGIVPASGYFGPVTRAYVNTHQ